MHGRLPLSDDWSRTLLPRGIVKGGDISKPLPLDEKKIAEDVTHSWYKGDENLYPFDGKTEPDYTGFDTNGNVKGGEKYSWCKAPNYENEPYEVGPLARFIVGYAQGHEQIKPLVDNTLKALGLPATVLFSTLGRTAARALETKLVADNVDGGSVSSSPTSRPETPGPGPAATSRRADREGASTRCRGAD
jgi:quinone-reactive Ni/Fe-hydrogenase large subunit